MFKNNSIKSTKRKMLIIRFIAALLMFIVGMVLALTLKAQVNKEKPGIFYSITGNGLTSYLFGTYHLVKSSYLDEIPAVNESFKKAKGVIVEIVIDPAASPGAMAMGMLKDKTLSAMLDKPFRDSLDKELKTVLGAGLDQLNQLKPANVTLTLSVVYLMINNNTKLNQYSGPLAHRMMDINISKALQGTRAIE